MSYKARYGITTTDELDKFSEILESVIDAVIYFVGFVFCWYLAFRLLRFSYLYTRPSSINDYRRKTSGSAGAWALVTGASDGIGFAFAYALASRGLNVVLHGRNQSKLDGCKEELLKAFPRLDFRILVADAAQSQKTEQQMKIILASVAALPGPLTTLVNNVGGMPSSILPVTMTALADIPLTAIESITNINALFTIRLTRTLLPTLHKNEPAVILNIGSLGSSLSLPRLSIYCGTKAFLMAWSTSLAREVEMDGMKVEVLGIPIGEVTGVSHLKTPPTFFTPSAKTMANACLDRVGCGRLVVVGYWTHAVQSAAIDLMPEVIVTWIAKRLAGAQAGRHDKAT